MLRRWFSVPRLWAILAICLGSMLFGSPALADKIDPYVIQYLRVTQPIALEYDSGGETRQFSPQDLSSGKELFKTNCLTCHVGGSTLPNPPISLSLKALKGATPPRDNITNLVAYMRHPVNYDSSAETYWCREVPETWLSQQQVENIAAFILTAAQKAPGWGTEEF